MFRSSLARIADLVLTKDPRTRTPLGVWLISTITYFLYNGIMVVQVMLGYTPAYLATRLIVASTLANLFFYVGIRYDWGPKWDRRFGIQQLVVGIVFMWVSYAVAGPVAESMVIIVASHIVYAMFSMPPRQVWQLVGVSLVGLASTMALSYHFRPGIFIPGHQLISFLYITLVVVLIARLAVLVNRMNEGLRTQSRELAQALEKVRQLATRDDLTQVHNRRHMTELMGIEQNQHERSGSPLCLALLDIDFFKSVNDNHGHQAGDDVLRRFAQATQQSLRTSDLLGRWGGEEFVVLFPDTGLDESQVALGRVHTLLKQTNFGNIAPGLAVTFSAGLVQIRTGERIEAAVERADQAMYRAKTSGRDCVVIDRDSDSVQGELALRA